MIEVSLPYVQWFSVQIINVYECNGKNIFVVVKNRVLPMAAETTSRAARLQPNMTKKFVRMSKLQSL